tara:strand:- start:711 stop:965 length:255 start_codon:yes stop_codon:yes gene_type:complete
MKNKIGGLFGRGSTRTKVDEFLSKKNGIDKELEMIRRKCNHTNKSIKLINEGGMHSWTVRWVCEDCLTPVGWPSEKEKENFLKS